MAISLQDAQAQFNSGGAQAKLSSDVGTLSPYVSTISSNPNAEQQLAAQPKVIAANASPLSKFSHFLGGTAGETGHIISGAVHWLATNAVSMAEAPIKLGAGLSHGIQDRQQTNSLNLQNQQISERLDSLAKTYKAGRISKTDYQRGLKEIAQDNANISSQENALNSRIGIDQTNTVNAGIDTASALVTILTAGFGKATMAITKAGLQPTEAMTAADYLGSKAASVYLKATEDHIGALASDSKLFSSLNTAAQSAIQRATAEVIASNAGAMTASELARASAVNVAIKYPVYFNYVSSQGSEIYKELDQGKYGDATRTIAFSALLLLSGGPIGQALKYGGGAVKAGMSRVFTRSTFLDQLSKSIGGGEADGLFQAVMKLPEEQRSSVIKNLSALEATNMGAVGGDAIAAANRVVKGMAGYEGMSLSNFTHEEALNNMVNFSEAQRLADTVAKDHGLGPITVGRVDARTLNDISSKLSPLIEGENKDSAMNAWDALKAENPNAAFANNENLDKQVRALILKHDTPATLDNALRNIKAQFTVEGFPKAEAQKLAKMGYLPIKPVNLRAPFQEGEGTLATRFTPKTNEFFTKAVQPAPILGHLGDLLTHMGLSPNASTQQVYQMYNTALAKNISDLPYAKQFINEGNENTADDIIKKLSNFMHNPTGGLPVAGTHIRLPITDMRQLSTKDIAKALDVSNKEAQQIGHAIMQSMLDVPLAVRGLGDKVVDYAQNIPGFKKYLQVQGGLRFAWNPFFRAKVSTKIEILAQAESGGKFPTVAGTNWILQRVFPDVYANIDDARGLLRDFGAFDTKAAAGMGGEAGEFIDAAGMAPNIGHHLTKSQERSIASLVLTQAKKAGTDLETFAHNNPQQVRDTVQMIAQYDRNANFLNSPLARTLNYAFFPFRFETKVATIMAKSLARTSPMTQLAVIKGTYNAHDWLNSPEGMAWYSSNADVIKTFEYFTPIQTLAEVSNALGGKSDSISNFGELGGLPFGFIPQLLNAEGLTHFGETAYVNPKTGKQLPSYIPQNDRARALAALQSFIGSLYSYPGSTLGFKSKTSVNQDATNLFLPQQKGDFKQVMGPLTPEQQQFQHIVQNLHGANNLPVRSSPVPEASTVPVSGSGKAAPKYKDGKKRTKAKKKSDYTPGLLPGQSTLGQL